MLPDVRMRRKRHERADRHALFEVHGDTEPRDERGPRRIEVRSEQRVGQIVLPEIDRHEGQVRAEVGPPRQDGALVGLRRGMVHLEEAAARIDVTKRGRVEARPEDDDLIETCMQACCERFFNIARARQHLAFDTANGAVKPADRTVRERSGQGHHRAR